ncbi:hypothetical protein BMS3Abin15_00935 [bacterium BMS3Abin15]|nr:hypothetical protein BMS3Abin15_00935 [bacterium BMS3Abin15]
MKPKALNPKSLPAIAVLRHWQAGETILKLKYKNPKHFEI